MDDFINSIVMWVLTPILNLFNVFFNFIFSSKVITLIFGFIFMNAIGFLLMYLDKKYAKEEKRRIKESTLFLVAILFGSIGILLGMKKFRHKTLHKSFVIGVPIIIIIQVIIAAYVIIKGLLF